MAEFEFDTELFVFAPLFILGSLASLSLIEADVLPIIDLGDTFLELGDVRFTFGRVLAIGGLAGVLINRDTELFDNLGAIEIWVVYATVGLIIAPPFFPIFADTLAQTPAAIIAFITQSAGFTLVSYIN